MRTAAALWELDGPLMTGPITSLKILGMCMSGWLSWQERVKCLMNVAGVVGLDSGNGTLIFKSCGIVTMLDGRVQ